MRPIELPGEPSKSHIELLGLPYRRPTHSITLIIAFLYTQYLTIFLHLRDDRVSQGNSASCSLDIPRTLELHGEQHGVWNDAIQQAVPETLELHGEHHVEHNTLFTGEFNRLFKHS